MEVSTPLDHIVTVTPRGSAMCEIELIDDKGVRLGSFVTSNSFIKRQSTQEIKQTLLGYAEIIYNN